MYAIPLASGRARKYFMVPTVHTRRISSIFVPLKADDESAFSCPHHYCSLAYSDLAALNHRQSPNGVTPATPSRLRNSQFAPWPYIVFQLRAGQIQIRSRIGAVRSFLNRVENYPPPRLIFRETAMPLSPFRTAPFQTKTNPSRASNTLPRVCSGDMYATVPIVVPGLVKMIAVQRVRARCRRFT